MRTIGACGACGDSGLEDLWALPQLPLTERFGPYNPDAGLSFDQALAMCHRCGHVQLRHQLDPSVLYTATEYSFRTSLSLSAQRGTSAFVDFLRHVGSEQRFRTLVDVGGNDLHLARLLTGAVANRVVIDPICADQDGQVVDGIQVVGRMIEDVDIREIAPAADLVTCRHTLEHIAAPRALLEQLMAETAPDAMFFVEIPDLDCLIEAQRFDAVFHQHYQYYDLATLRQLIARVGGEYVAHEYNHQGSCGGALMVAFRRARRPASSSVPDLVARERRIRQRIAAYEAQMGVMAALIRDASKPLFGYGASLMLATLGYHLRTDFSDLECILDDAPGKDGATYQNVPVKVRYVGEHHPPRNASFLVTSLENVRPIVNRLAEFTPRRILVPLVI